MDPPSTGDEAGRQADPFAPKVQGPLLGRIVPVTRRLPGYVADSLRPDTIAGLTVAALAVPSAMAYAQLAGLSPVAGLYALLLPALAYAAFGTSRQLIVGPEGTLAIMVAGAVAPLVGTDDPTRYGALAAMSAVLVGGIALIARVLRLGWISDYFSLAVLVGYLHGVAVVLIVGQMEKLTGMSIDASDPIPQLREFFQEIGSANGPTVVVAAVSLAAVLLLRWLAPKLPGALIVVVGGIAASYAFDLSSHGVAVVGEIPAGLPSFAWPGVGLDDVVHLLPAALGMFAVGYADGILTARSFAGRHRQHVDANQELIAMGAANLAAGVTAGFPVGASGSRTAVNDQIGGRTQLVGVFAAIIVAVVLLFLTGPVGELPTACLGAVIVAAAIGLIEPADWRNLARAGRSQVVIAAVTFIGVITIGVLQALIIAVALSILDTVSRRAQPHDAVLGWVDRLGRYADVSLHPSAKVTASVVVYRIDGGIFFADASYFKARVHEAVAGSATRTRYLVLDAEGINEIDASGGEALRSLVIALRAEDIALVVARLKDPLSVQFDSMGLTKAIGPDQFFPTTRGAVSACEARLAARSAEE